MKTRKTKSWMKQETKLMYIMEHILAIEDLLKDNIDGAVLSASVRDIKMILERQLQGCDERDRFAK
tara:strand:- start:44 stop:241 length:198 start_codon:yes stop_codon:yes gene_type:complete